MSDTVIDLVVTEGGECSLLKKGDRYELSGREMKPGPGTRYCASGICSIYARIRQKVYEGCDPNGMIGDVLTCREKDCGTTFRIEAHRRKQTLPFQHQLKTTRRFERGAQAVSSMLKDAGPFLNRVSPDVVAPLMVACDSQRFPPGHAVLEAGVIGNELYIVWEGEVEVVRMNPTDNTETVLAVLGKGECFGEMSLLTGQPTSALVRTRGDTTIMVLPKDRFETQLASSPELNRVFSKLLADRLRVVNVTLESELARGILGKFSMISLVDLVQTLNASRRTGTLVVNGKGREGRLAFEGGKLTAAIWGDLAGEQAFFEVASWPEGDFCFEQEILQVTDQNRIDRDTMNLLMECARLQDESGEPQV